FDMRSKEEVTSDPLRAFPHVWSGQLVQATDHWIGVRRARLVLADDLGLRAALAAFWLRVLGFDVHVTYIDNRLRALSATDSLKAPSLAMPEIEAAAALSEASRGCARLLDLRPSWRYASGHVVGSHWSIRPKLAAFADADRLLLIGDEGPEAELGARELQRLGCRNFALVKGGVQALSAAGAPIQVTEPLPLATAIDVTSFAHGRHDGDLDASRRYLDWEQGLIQTLSSEERAAFGL
ncbi:MAG: rhodanese-like domain-containing protein, partial [Geminicoccaceae bacterium]